MLGGGRPRQVDLPLLQDGGQHHNPAYVSERQGVLVGHRVVHEYYPAGGPVGRIPADDLEHEGYGAYRKLFDDTGSTS